MLITLTTVPPRYTKGEGGGPALPDVIPLGPPCFPPVLLVVTAHGDKCVVVQNQTQEAQMRYKLVVRPTGVGSILLRRGVCNHIFHPHGMEALA